MDRPLREKPVVIARFVWLAPDDPGFWAWAEYGAGRLPRMGQLERGQLDRDAPWGQLREAIAQSAGCTRSQVRIQRPPSGDRADRRAGSAGGQRR